MEALSPHAVESHLSAPPPRPARLPLRLTLLLAVATLLLAAFVLGGVRALWEAGKLGWLAGAGRTAAARIDGIRTAEPQDPAAPPVQSAVHYSLDLPGHVVRAGWIGFASVSPLPGGRMAAPAPAFALGQSLPVRYAPWFGGVLSQPWGDAPGGRVTTLLLTGGLILLVSLGLARRLTRWLRAYLHLLRHGRATVGTVTHKRTEVEDAVRYFLRFGYSAAGEGREREEQVGAEQWKLFQVGQPVTVLYDPAKPEHAGLYALMG